MTNKTPSASSLNSEEIRLQKYIALSGLASRRLAENWISSGLVKVNGVKVCQLGTKITPDKDRVIANGELIKPKPQSTKAYALHKPKNCICTFKDPEQRQMITEFFPKHEQRLLMAGRLDYDASGLMILTTDGQLAQQIAHPSKQAKKTYLVKVQGRVSKTTLHALRNFKQLEGQALQTIQAEVASCLPNKTWLQISLQEGKNRQIKKMLDILEHRVLKIHRVQVGSIELGDLPAGAWRRLSEKEIKSLQA